MAEQSLTADAAEAPAPEQAKTTIAHMLGEVCWVLSQSRMHRHFSLGDLEWMAMPPILAGQFRVFHGDKTPVGFAIWAFLSEEAEARMRAQVEAGAGARLRPEDWRSGDRAWLIELVSLAPGDERVTQAMLEDLAVGPLRGRRFQLYATEAGKREVKRIG